MVYNLWARSSPHFYAQKVVKVRCLSADMSLRQFLNVRLGNVTNSAKSWCQAKI
jgi:hypothetical protein